MRGATTRGRILGFLPAMTLRECSTTHEYEKRKKNFTQFDVKSFREKLFRSIMSTIYSTGRPNFSLHSQNFILQVCSISVIKYFMSVFASAHSSNFLRFILPKFIKKIGFPSLSVSNHPLGKYALILSNQTNSASRYKSIYWDFLHSRLRVK